MGGRGRGTASVIGRCQSPCGEADRDCYCKLRRRFQHVYTRDTHCACGGHSLVTRAHHSEQLVVSQSDCVLLACDGHTCARLLALVLIARALLCLVCTAWPPHVQVLARRHSWCVSQQQQSSGPAKSLSSNPVLTVCCPTPHFCYIALQPGHHTFKFLLDATAGVSVNSNGAVGLPISLVPSPRSPQVERRARWVVVDWLPIETVPGGMQVGVGQSSTRGGGVTGVFFPGGGVLTRAHWVVVDWLPIETEPGVMQVDGLCSRVSLRPRGVD